MSQQDERTIETLERIKARGLAEKAEAICAAHHVTLLEACSRRRLAPMMQARTSLFRWVREDLGWSYPAIGWLFDRDHTTVFHALNKGETT